MKACLLSSIHPCFDVRIFQKEARSLSQAGYDVTLVAVADFEERMVEGVRVIGLPKPRRRILRTLNWWRIVRFALREKADLYHFHDPDLLLPALLIRILTRRPVVYDVHENYPEDILTKEWIPAPLRRLLSLGFRLFEDTVVRLMDGVVVVNQHLAQRFQGKSQVVIVRNYSRLEPFLDSETPRQSATPYFVYAGRISDDRGIYECLQALVSIPDAPATLLCAGTIGHVANGELRRLLDGSPHPRFEYLGLLPYGEIPPLFKGALAGLLCFLPTPNNLLGTPNKLFEYMSAGIPVIASDFPFLREVVAEAGCGLLVEPDDVQQIASAMASLLRDREQAAQMGQNGLRAARERYNWQAEEPKLLALYQTLLGSSATGTRGETP
ncbi:MAG TPA: glycosyltransferase family 4 protein [Anaerolineae bacterium]|nr:glycosyltransferase family 4 protein [Anaerolineae bacterium]